MKITNDTRRRKETDDKETPKPVTLDGTFANGQWQVLDEVSGYGGLWRIGDEGKGSVTGCKSQHIYSKHIPTLYKIPKPSTIGKLHEKNPGDHE